MKNRRFWAVLLSCFILIGCFTPAMAVEAPDGSPAIARAIGRLNNRTIPANTIIGYGGWIYLDAKETVKFDCTYTPSSASVDFGVIDANNVFYPLNTTSGSINEAIRVEELGQYLIAIRNNEDYDVTVTGTVKY